MSKGSKAERLRSDGKYIAKEAAELRMSGDELLMAVKKRKVIGVMLNGK